MQTHGGHQLTESDQTQANFLGACRRFQRICVSGFEPNIYYMAGERSNTEQKAQMYCVNVLQCYIVLKVALKIIDRIATYGIRVWFRHASLYIC